MTKSIEQEDCNVKPKNKYCRICSIEIYAENASDINPKLCDSCEFEDAEGNMYEDFDV